MTQRTSVDSMGPAPASAGDTAKGVVAIAAEIVLLAVDLDAPQSGALLNRAVLS
jgi:hypothetical protein